MRVGRRDSRMQWLPRGAPVIAEAAERSTTSRVAGVGYGGRVAMAEGLSKERSGANMGERERHHLYS